MVYETISEELALKLIELAKKSSKVRAALYELLVEHFVTKDEVKRILEELKALREDFNVRMEEMRGDFNRRIEALERRMLALQESFENRMTEMREDFNKRVEALEMRMVEMREDFNRRIEALEQRMIEIREDFNKRVESLERRMLILQESFERRMTELREDFNRRMQQFAEQLSALGTRWGVLAEDAFREALRGILRQYGIEVRRWEYYDSEGLVYGAPSVVEVDVLVRDDVHMLIEIKSSVDRSDVAELVRIGQLYERVSGVKPVLVIVSPFVRERARKLAEKIGIRIFTSSDDLINELKGERERSR